MKRLIYLLTFLFIFLINATLVSAHPADIIGISVYDQKQTLKVSGEATDLQIDLTFYAFEKLKLWGSINTDLDQSLSDKEKHVWMNKGSDSSWLMVSGKKYKFEATAVSIPDFDEFFSKKPVNITISFISKVKLKPGEVVTYFYNGKDQKLENINFEVKGGSGFNVTDLTPSSFESKTFKVTGESAGSSQISQVKASGRLNKFLEKYVKVDKISPKLIAIALIVSFLIGMLHALTPGHGKAIVAGFLVGEKGNIAHAVQMGLIITITHTASVFLLGIGILFLTQYVVPSVIISRINLISGLMVMGFGIYLLFTRIKGLSGKHSHKHSGIDEYLNHDHKHVHHSHSHLSDHDHSDYHSNIELSWKNLLPLGISGGLVPCVDALAILIVAVSLQKIVFGIVLLITFSLGLATALIIGGIIVVLTKKVLFKKISTFKNYEKYISIASALIVTILGVAIVFGKQL